MLRFKPAGRIRPSHGFTQGARRLPLVGRGSLCAENFAVARRNGGARYIKASLPSDLIHFCDVVPLLATH